MIHQRAAARELMRTGAGVFAVLFSVLMTTYVVRLLRQAAAGQITPDVVLVLLGYSALGALPVLLSLTVFLSMLLTFSRWYRDSEMVIWLTAGIPLRAWLGQALRFAAPFVLVIGLLSTLVTPWATGHSRGVREKLDTRDDLALVTPGAFNESTKADRVFFVEAASDLSGGVRNVFVSSNEPGKTTVIATAAGRSEITPDGERFLILENGRRYDIFNDSAAFRVMEFARYGVRVDARETAVKTVSFDAMPTLELLKINLPRARSELLWRFGIPLSAVILALLAVPLSFVNPRAARTSNLLVALLVFTIYSNLLGASGAWVSQGRVSLLAGFLAIHGLMLVLLLLLMALRTRLWSLRVLRELR